MTWSPAGLAALDLLPEAVVVVGADRTVAHVNDRARRVLGLEGDVDGRPIRGLLDLRTDDGTPCADPVPARGVSHRLAPTRWIVRLPDGRERRVEMAGRWTDDDGIVLSFRRSEQADRPPDATADVVATVSHELRAPLATVRGFAKSMLRDWDRFSDEQRRTFLAAIEEDVDRVSRLLDDLVVVSRLGAERTQLRPEPVDLVGLVDAVVTKAQVRHGDREVTVAQGGPARLDRVVDPQRIEQVVTNLVENALVHAPAARVVVRVGTVGDDAVVDVVDDGPGVPTDRRDRIFERLGRGNDRAPGAGLGLFVARGLARAHGGDVALVDDGEHTGAHFRLVLPATPHDDA